MCILCIIQKWSRRVATMLPWLVIPLIGLWALSRLLPPAFRFEITSPRLACVFALLVTLFWYEILMPQLSSWRVRRNAQLREKKRFEAIEMQKLRKTATRRCRNCLTPYRDQNPGGGRFMCSYCGHISKRPVLDLPVPPGMGIANTRIIKDLVGKGGKILNGKVWPENSWMCGEEWFENGNWVGGSFAGNPTYWQKSGSGFFGGDNHCMAEISYFGVVTFACKLLTYFVLSISWLWRKIFRTSSSREDDLSDADHRGMFAKRGENGTEHESRSDKAHRKAEEKRLARLEKELLEEEERKQREEVARLVEERIRLRDEKMEAEKDRGRGLAPVREKDGKKEAEKKRQERRKDKDKGSSKRNADAEELEKKAGKESYRKQEFDKKTDFDQRESVRAHSTDLGNGLRSVTANNYTRVNAGTRYLDRMRGSFLSSSKAFGGGSFFGSGGTTPATIPKENRSSGYVEHAQSSPNRRELHQPEPGVGKVNMDADDKYAGSPVPSDPQPMTMPKKSWQQLFTRSPAVPSSSNSNVISRPSQKFQADVQSPQLSSQSLPTQSFNNPINFGLPSPFTLSNFSNGSTISSSGFPSLNECMFPRAGKTPHDSLPEEPELFEDPCYVPDPVSLLGPVSESLDNFQLDLGASFVRDIGLEKPRSLRNVVAPSEVSRPSPIESPLSRLRMADDKFTGSNRFLSIPKPQDMQTSPLGDSKSPNENGTWQMWNSSPLGQDGLGLVGGLASWLLPPEKNRSNKEDFVHSASYKNMASLFTKEEQVTFASPVGGATDRDPWSERVFYPPSSASENHFAFNPQEEATKKEMMFGNPSKSATSHPFELPPANCWSKKEWAVQGSGEEAVANSSAVKPHIGGLYSTPDVQSLWSYD